MFCLNISLCITCLFGTQGGQKVKGQIPLDWSVRELQVAMWVLRTEAFGTQPVLLTMEPSLQLPPFSFLFPLGLGPSRVTSWQNILSK